MFTGIIEETGKLQNLRESGGKRYFTIDCKIVTNDLKIGDSVACNGICLTVVDYSANRITVEAMNETLMKTTAGSWKVNSVINLERAMQLGSRLDGHIVQGHIDTKVPFLFQETEGETVYLWFKLPSEYSGLVVPQGSIAVNGVSLTIARLEKEKFAVALISHTIQETNLNDPGKEVNIEFDIIGKYILRNQKKDSGITMEWLRENNF